MSPGAETEQAANPVLLRTKLAVPRIHQDMVPRANLLQKLDDIDFWRFAVVSAPAGFGKTTLTAAWIRRSAAAHPSWRIGWLTLDEHDNDPIGFWTYAVHAIRAQMPDSCRGALRLLISPQPPPIDVILTELINELSLEASQEKPCFLVFDDYHHIVQPIHEQLSFFMQNLPPDFHVILGTRKEPPLPLPRWRVQGHLLEIGQEELRFSLNETAAFLTGTMKLKLDPDVMETLAQKTEGWIAGLQLAALTMREREDCAAFLKTFSGSHRHILDYLSEEVLDRLPEPVMEFICRTSVLERLSPSLCDALTRRSDGRALLEWMEENNLFITAVDGEPVWYRFHNLFREMALNRLRRLAGDDEIGGLHRRASAWFEDNGLLTDAIEHSLAVRDYENAARLMEKETGFVLTNPGYPGSLRLIQALPESLIESRAYLCLVYAVALLSKADFAASDLWISKAEKALGVKADTEDDERLPRDIVHFLGWMDAIRSTVMVNLGSRSEVFEIAHRALLRLPQDDRMFRCIVALNLGDAHSERAEGGKAEEAYLEAIESGKTSGNLIITIVAMASLGMLKARQGKLHEAYWMYQGAIDTARLTGGQLLPVAGKAEIFMARVLLEWKDFGTAEKLARDGIEHCRQWGHQEHLADGYQTLADIQNACGKSEEARKTIASAEQLIRLIMDKHRERGFKLPNEQTVYRMTRIAESKNLIPESPTNGSKTRTEPVNALVEPLTERELGILRLIADGRSNPEIAHELYLAVGTVKKHTNNIFSKLGVTSRTQALLKAKELHLI